MILAVKGAVAGSVVAKLPYIWVVAGDTGSLRTTTNTPAETVTYTSRTSSFGTSGIKAVASSGSRFVAVGASGKLAVSDDGITWTQKTSSFGTDTITGVGWGNGQWVACSSATNKLAYSTDNAETWTQITVSGMTIAADGSLQTSGPNPAYGGGYWVMGGNNGDLVYATSAAGSWTRIQSATTTIATSTSICATYLTGSSLWIIGTEASVTANAMATASTPNGTWTARSIAASQAGNSWLLSTPTAAVLAGGNALTPLLNYQSSTNGTTWTDRTPADTSSYATAAAGGIDNSNRIWSQKLNNTDSSEYSTDGGATWSAITVSGGSIAATCVAHSEPLPGSR